MAARGQARQAALLTRAGSIVGVAGDESSVDVDATTRTLAAVATGLGFGGRDLCQLLGEDPPGWMLIRGARQTALLAEMPDDMLLLAVFPFDILETEAQTAVEWLMDRLIAVCPPRTSGFGAALSPELRGETLAALEEVLTR
jgi:predicted regulator of Ras-like GTPase activity (Roadblock/LC7/MglB family)